jgi:N-glycosylase/DNA lyase
MGEKESDKKNSKNGSEIANRFMKKQLRLFEEKTDTAFQNFNSHTDETATLQSVMPYIENLPSEYDEVLPGIKWGNYAQLYTPAFWKLQYMLSDFSNDLKSHRLASNIVEEIVMCILGGYGIPAEMGIVAFERMKERQIIHKNSDFESVFDALSSPFHLSNGKSVHYRFFNQKSQYIHKFLNRSDLDAIPEFDDIELRNWLLSIDGIGLKTASWITRNWLNSDNVAILDVHLLRAGKLAGFFESAELSNYLKLEEQYLNFCCALEVRASNLDALIWSFMKKNTNLAVRTLYS